MVIMGNGLEVYDTAICVAQSTLPTCLLLGCPFSKLQQRHPIYSFPLAWEGEYTLCQGKLVLNPPSQKQTLSSFPETRSHNEKTRKKCGSKYYHNTSFQTQHLNQWQSVLFIYEKLMMTHYNDWAGFEVNDNVESTVPTSHADYKL